MKKSIRVLSILLSLLMLVSCATGLELSAGAANVTSSAVGATQLSSCTITLSATTFYYNGSPQKPVVTVKNGSTKLTAGTDYTVAYQNHVKVGTAKVVVTGKGSYTGSVTKTYSIKNNIANAAVTLSASSYTYNAGARKPAVTVKDGSTTLTAGTHYTVAYQNNVNAGTAKAVVTGKGTYGNSKTVTFKINARPIGATSVLVTPGSYVYDGKAKTPVVTITDGTKTLVKDTDFTVAYENNSGIGDNTAKAVITGKGNYTGTVTKTFSITKRSVANCTVKFANDKTDYPYRGRKISPSFSVYDGSGCLAPGTEYTYTIENNINAGTAKIIISGTGGFYTGTKTETFTISPKDLAKCTLDINGDSYVYSGSAVVPEVTVKDGNTTVAASNYTVSCTENVNAGTATVTVKGKGNYTGTLKKTFTVSPKTIHSCTITLSPSSVTYDRKAKTPAVTVKDGTKTLTSADYTVSYINNVNAGTATVAVTGKGNYSDTVNKTFKITSKSISGTSLTLRSTNFIYDGTAKVPAVIVFDDAVVLTEGKDFTVSCTDNVNVGYATLTITGKGNYSGTQSAKFHISPADVSRTTANLGSGVFIYDGNAKAPSVSVMDSYTAAYRMLEEGKDYTVTFTNNVNVGDAVATITGKGNYKGTKTEKYHITQADVSRTTVNLGSTVFVYDGNAKVPSVSVMDSYTSAYKLLEEGKDYTVTFTDNVNIGDAVATVTGKGNYKGTKTATYHITNSIESADVALSSNQYTYDGKEKKPDVLYVKLGNVTLNEGVDYTVEYKDNKNAGKASVVITANGKYRGSKTAAFTINKANINNCFMTVNNTNPSYTGSEKKVSVTVKNGNTTITNGQDYTLVYSNNVNVGNATVEARGINNYTGSIKKTFAITEFSYGRDNWTFNNSAYYFRRDNATSVFGSGASAQNVLNELQEQWKWYENYYSKKYHKLVDSCSKYTSDEKVSISGKVTFVTSVLQDDGTLNYSNPDEVIKYIDSKFKCVAKVNGQLLTRDKHYELTYSIPEKRSDDGITRVSVNVTGINGNTGKSFITLRLLFANPDSSWCHDNVIDAAETVYGAGVSQDTKDSWRKSIYDARLQKWEGSCEGMTYTNILLSKRDPKLIQLYELVTGKKFTNVRNITCNVDIISIINYLHRCPNDIKRKILGRDTRYKDTTANLGDITKYDKITLIKDSHTGIEAKDFAFHAIAAYGVEEAYYTSSVTNETYDRRILIYDPNTTPAPQGDSGVKMSECIYYNSKTHSYIRPSHTNSRYALYWTNPTKENPETDNTLFNTPYCGGIRSVSACGSYATTVYNMPAIKSALNPNGIKVWLKNNESRYPTL